MAHRTAGFIQHPAQGKRHQFQMRKQTELDIGRQCRQKVVVEQCLGGKQVQLLENEIRYLCTKAREIFISQPILLELEAPIKVCSTC